MSQNSQHKYLIGTSSACSKHLQLLNIQTTKWPTSSKSKQNLCPNNEEDASVSNESISSNNCENDQAQISMGKQPVHNKRGVWHHQLDFLLSLIGYCVGLGNLWRFPFKCYKNGGGAFLFPYFLCLILAGMPLYYMELALGQFTSRGPLGAFEMAPIFKGIGYGMVVICWFCCIYYNVVIAWIVYYLYNSLTFKLPWASCNNPWNSPNCSATKYECEQSGGFMNGYDCIRNKSEPYIPINISIQWVAPSEEFWKKHVLNQTEGITEFGGFQWHLVASLAFAWVLVYICLLKGIKSSGKVVWVTSTLPYLLLIILFLQTVQLKGAFEGIRYYLTPQWERLSDPLVWGDAAQQIFYSLGLAFGCLMTMASYNRFENNIARDAVLVSLVNCFTSVLGGFVIFSVIGFMSVETGRPVNDVASEGAGLAFVVYPEAVVRLPGSSAWAIVFFLMLLSLGLDSQFSMFETVTTAIFDRFPETRKYKPIVVGVACAVMFVLALPMVTQSGIYWLTLLDTYSAGFSLMFISLFETICIVYIYGVKRFSIDIETMIGSKPGSLLKLGWGFVTPVSMLSIFLFNMYNYAPVKFEGQSYPVWADCLGWAISMCSVVMVPVTSLVEFSSESGNFKQRISKLTKPSKLWGPSDAVNRIEYERKLNDIVTNQGANCGSASVGGIHFLTSQQNQHIPDENRIALSLA